MTIPETAKALFHVLLQDYLSEDIFVKYFKDLRILMSCEDDVVLKLYSLFSFILGPVGRCCLLILYFFVFLGVPVYACIESLLCIIGHSSVCCK